MSVWTLEYNGTERAISSWGLSGLVITRTSQAPDEVSAVHDGAAFDADAFIPYDGEVKIKKDGVQWFVGRRNLTPRLGSPTNESMSYLFSGPWQDLDEQPFQQVWQHWDADAGALTNHYKSRIVLGQAFSGARQTAGEAILEVIQYAAASGISVQAGTIDVDIQVPWSEVVDITCGEAIRTILRWLPDAVTWFDYATSPPTLHCRRRADLTAVALAVDGTDVTEEVEITRRDDLQVPAVVIKYEQEQVVDDNTWELTVVDAYPLTATGRERKAVVMTVQLAGSSTMHIREAIETEALPLDLNDLAWWKTKLEWLDHPQVVNAVVREAQRLGHSDPAGFYEYELTKGSIHPWMTSEVEEDLIEALVDYTTVRFDDAGEEHSEVVNKRVTYKFIATSLETGEYKTIDEVEAGEPVPTGIAQKFYDAVNPYQYAGSISTVDEEVAGLVTPGTVVNLSRGSQSGWAAMRALVQSVTENVDSGTTFITIGPATHLGPADLIEYLRANRTRHTSRRWKARHTGDSFDAAASVDMEAYTPISKPSSGAGEETKKKIWKTDGPNRISIDLDPGKVSKTDTAVEIEARELTLLEGGQYRQRQVMASEAYGTAEDAAKESVERAAADGKIHLVNDADAPGASKVYGTNASGEKGWHASTGGDCETRWYRLNDDGTYQDPVTVDPGPARAWGYWDAYLAVDAGAHVLHKYEKCIGP